jgi:hypothetical protein
MPKVVISRKPYDARVLQAWTMRRRNALKFPNATADFARLLKKKVRGRGNKTQRFFGEAYVASVARPREAYYGSFKWLTNKRFAGSGKFPKGPAHQDQERFRGALQRHFGLKRLERLQRAVQALCRTCRKQLAGKAPTAPDLWLVDRRGRHRFIEVKLPGDSVAPHQLAGMAAIACVLKRPHRVSVEVIYLHDDDRMFKNFCRAAAG